MKVVKSYSLDLDVVQMLEKQHTDAYGDIGSKSQTVNDAIRWYLSGDVADLVRSQRSLMAKVRELAMRNDSEILARKPWWKRLLGLN
jgi:hypothetical protein